MTTRRRTAGTSTSHSTTGTRKPNARRRAAAATLLPLALGVASMKMPSGNPASTQSHLRGGPPIQIACSLPFDAIKLHHPIDDSCGLDGNADANTPQAAQNEAKNNFCATGAPVNVNFAVLRQLQEEAAAAVTFGSIPQLPKDRSPIKSLPSPVGEIGEGRVVRIAAFVIDAHPSDIGNGESVNCNTPGAPSNDIHIVMGENSNHDDDCSSAVAEITPHFRPAAWVAKSLTQNNEHLFRFTGQLMFDAAHRICSGTSKPNPKRSTLWEIHPVYAVDVCMDPGNNCTVDKEAGWVALAEVANDETHLGLPRQGSKDSLAAASVIKSSHGSLVR
ncbi:MAG: hypothetical protein ACM3MF_11850 [Anaerolineae bacterium]